MQIAEVAKRYGISVDTIRYYERIGLVPHVTRLPNGHREASRRQDRQLPAGRRMLGRRRRMAAQGIARSFPRTLFPTRKERPFPALLSTRQGRQWIRRMRPLPTCYIPSP